ncbi:MAG TPA: lysophospholipid acyltransferase family protein [Cytophagaceae bacterium]|jgi:1-acyl-sn-glycerol-3-phosphate acyltransferase|nr:lysophospholipid acyltransferase family protein [Cytophagaceae bacterium]
MKVFKFVYKYWVFTWFVSVFLILFPFFVLFTQRESWKPAGQFLNKLWAYIVFWFCFLPTKIVFHFRPSAKKSYVYCANHSSYMDIPSLCYALPGYFMFIGKSSLAKVPLFGYMFRNLHIPVDRSSARSKFDTLQKSLEAIDKGRSLAYFPEGTIPKSPQPSMIEFKDGAFRVAIEKQVPIVPVTIPYNWLILPDDGSFVPHRHLMKVIIHEPIETKGMTLESLDDLKIKTFTIIYQELLKQHELLNTKQSN